MTPKDFLRLLPVKIDSAEGVSFSSHVYEAGVGVKPEVNTQTLSRRAVGRQRQVEFTSLSSDLS